MSSPPTPPIQVTPKQRIADLQYEIDVLNARETSVIAELEGCVGTRTRACGLSTTEAPHPWLGLNGQKCRGYDTLSARYADYCGYWDASYNVDAAPADEKKCAP